MTKKETELIDELKNKFKLEPKIQRKRRIWVSFDSNNIIKILFFWKGRTNRGFVFYNILLSLKFH